MAAGAADPTGTDQVGSISRASIAQMSTWRASPGILAALRRGGQARRTGPARNAKVAVWAARPGGAAAPP